MDKDFIIKDGVLVKYTGTQEKIKIPNKITSIGEKAFCDNRYIKEVEIGKNITKIGKSAFANCYNLRTVVFKNNLEFIETQMFEECDYLRKVILPKNCKKINRKAFSKCLNLNEINLENITTIEKFAFQECKIDNVKIKEIECIEEFAFDNSNIKNFKVEKTIKNIKDKAFLDCLSLYHFSAEKIIKMSEKTFVNTKLKNIEIKEPVFKNENNDEYIIEDNVIYTIDKKEMVYCAQNAKPSNYKIPDTVEIIKENCFYGNETIRVLTFGENLKDIQKEGLCNTYIEEIIGNKKLEKIGQNAFLDGLINYIDLTNTQISTLNPIETGLFDDADSEQTLIIPKNIKEINFENIFYNELTNKNIIIKSSKIPKKVIDEIMKNNCEILYELEDKTLDELLEEGKSFKEANDIIKNQER